MQIHALIILYLKFEMKAVNLTHQGRSEAFLAD